MGMDADYRQIQMLQKKLDENGISREELDLDMYAGLTYSELKSICDYKIKKKMERENNAD